MFWWSCCAVMVAGGAADTESLSIRPRIKSRDFFILSSLEKRKRNGGGQGAVTGGRQMQAVAGIISRRQVIRPGWITDRLIEIQYRVEMDTDPGVYRDPVGLGDGFGMIG